MGNVHKEEECVQNKAHVLPRERSPLEGRPKWAKRWYTDTRNKQYNVERSTRFPDHMGKCSDEIWVEMASDTGSKCHPPTPKI